MAPKNLNVKIYSPEKTLYEGQAIAISGYNNKGLFDILPMHSDFISVIKGKMVVFVNQQDKREFEDIHGVIRCFDNEVTVFLGI